jgi:type I restriction enzyme S subunit
LRAGDLLIIRSNGSVDLVGKCCVVNEQAAGMLFAGYLMRLRMDAARALPKFVYLALSSPSLRALIERTAKSTSGVNNINSEELRSLPVHLPPLEEQAEIVRRVETLFALADRLEARLRAAQTATERLTPSLLAKAFRGELVPQDPSDEPASELLKRLASSAETSATKRARRGRSA